MPGKQPLQSAIYPAVSRSGPHFLDWAEMAERGTTSCVSVPVYLNGVPRGVITFASSEPGTFSRCYSRTGCSRLPPPEHNVLKSMLISVVTSPC